MIHIICSDEIFLREEKIAEIIEKHQDYPKPQKFFLGEDEQHRKILGEINNPSLFNDKKALLLISHRSPLTQDTEKTLLCLAENLNETSVGMADEEIMIILSLPQLSSAVRKKKWFTSLNNKGKYVALYSPTGRKLYSWIATKAKSMGLKIDAEAIEYLSQNSEGNLLAAVQELEKLRMRYGEQAINYEEIKEGLGDNSYYDLFSLTDAFLTSDIARCKRMIDQLRMLATAPSTIIWLLQRDIKMLLALIDNPQMRDAELYRFNCFGPRQSLARSAARKFKSPNNLVLMLKLLASADQAAKGGTQENTWQILEGIVFTLAGASRSPAFLTHLKNPSASTIPLP